LSSSHPQNKLLAADKSKASLFASSSDKKDSKINTKNSVEALRKALTGS
ncbi:unnamed protein product, partial [Brassica oleracea]